MIDKRRAAIGETTTSCYALRSAASRRGFGDRQSVREERRDDRQEGREERRDDRQEVRGDRERTTSCYALRSCGVSRRGF